MNLMRVIALFLLSIYGSSVIAQQLVPFDTWKTTRGNWFEDPTEISYVGARCNALMAMVGGYFLMNPGKQEDVKTGQGVVDRGKAFLFVSLFLGTGARGGMSSEAFTSRQLLLTQTYSNKIIENKRLHNNIFESPILEDFNFCVSVESFFGEMNKRISETSR